MKGFVCYSDVTVLPIFLLCATFGMNFEYFAVDSSVILSFIFILHRIFCFFATFVAFLAAFVPDE